MARLCDDLAADYDLIYTDWDASIPRQGTALGTLISTEVDLVTATST